MHAQLVKIGTIAREEGVPISTIHFNVSQGFPRPTERTDGGYQLFNMHITLAKIKRI